MVASSKFREVEELAEIIASKPVTGIVNIGNIPAPQLQKMRESLREKGTMRVAKNSLLSLALEKFALEKSERDGMEKLINSIKGETALLSTDMNPFKLFKEIKAMKTEAPAKGGETAPRDIIVEEGDTPFKPGPIVGELQKAGIPAAIQRGKVAIKKTTTVVKKDEKIPRDVAKMLTRLEIHPLEIGLDLRAIYEDGMIYTPAILDIDESEIIKNIGIASSTAFNLAMDIGYITPTTIKPMLQKAYRESFALAVKADIFTPETVKEKISLAHSRALSLAELIKNKNE